MGQFVGTLAVLLATAAMCLTPQPGLAQTGQNELDTAADLESKPVIYFDSDEYVVPSACLTAMLMLAFNAVKISCTSSPVHSAARF